MPLTARSLPLRLSLLALVLATVQLSAQEIPADDSLDYFPYRAGDTWRLRRDDIPGYPPSLYTVHRDSIGVDGTRYLPDLNISIDTAGDVYSDGNLLYRLRAKVGDRWRQKSDNSDSALPFYATCVDIGYLNFFGETRRIKVFNYWYDASEGGLPDSMWYATRWLASGIGVMQEYYEPDAFFYTSGAIIGGEAYGDMIASVGADQPSLLHAARVVPNPFAEGTTLSYHLAAREHVRLTISNARGQVVAIPMDDFQNPGEQSVEIDGRGLPAGTYFYRLRTSTHTITGTLVRHF